MCNIFLLKNAYIVYMQHAFIMKFILHIYNMTLL